MKAIHCTKYGPPEVLQLIEIEPPVPGNKEILIQIHSTAVTASDCIVRGFKLPVWHPVGFLMGLVLGYRKPRNPVLGMIVSGTVETVGKNVKLFKPGEQVFGWTLKSVFKMQFGTYAEYICLEESSILARKPDTISHEHAAAIPYGGLLALYFIKRGKIRRGQKVLIYGASGSIGTSAVQLARYLGAEVTGVCSTSNLDLVRSLGAHKVIDYTKDDIATSDLRFDFILDAVGKKKSSEFKRKCKKLLNSNGKYISVDSGNPTASVKDMEFLKELVESGYLKPVIDRTYPLEQIVDAHRYVDLGHKKGNVMITINP